MWIFTAESFFWVLAAFWPAVLAVFTVVFVGVRFPPHLHKVFFVGASASLALCLGLALREASIPANNLLTRDVAAYAVVGALAPIASYCAALLCRHRPAWVLVAVPAATGLVPVLASPFVLLMVHCSSGDCL